MKFHKFDASECNLDAISWRRCIKCKAVLSLDCFAATRTKCCNQVEARQQMRRTLRRMRTLLYWQIIHWLRHGYDIHDWMVLVSLSAFDVYQSLQSCHNVSRYLYAPCWSSPYCANMTPTSFGIVILSVGDASKWRTVRWSAKIHEVPEVVSSWISFTVDTFRDKYRSPYLDEMSLLCYSGNYTQVGMGWWLEHTQAQCFQMTSVLSSDLILY